MRMRIKSPTTPSNILKPADSTKIVVVVVAVVVVVVAVMVVAVLVVVEDVASSPTSSVQ